MSANAGSSPRSGRFKKGQSGNPGGRPRKQKVAACDSAFDIVIDRTLSIEQDGVSREVTVEEALQHQLVKDAIAGKRTALRDVLKMIEKREAYQAQFRPPPERPPIKRYIEEVPANVDDAMLILGIIEEDNWCPDVKFDRKQLLLAPWAVQAALSRRRGGASLTDDDIEDIKRCTRDPDTLKWPRGTRV